MAPLQFFNDMSSISFVFVTGACRVGKTSLSNYLAQHPQIEFLDEPWEVMMFPFLAEDQQPSALLFSYFKALLSELANEIMLYRRANLRFTDASSIWKSKAPHKVYERLLLMNSRAQVKETLLQQEIKILLTLPETTPFIEFFFANVPNLKIINLVRNGLDVAKEIADKGWFSLEQLTSPKNSQPYRLIQYQSKDYYLPWWVNQEEGEAFICISDFERALWYWHYFHSNAIQQKMNLAPNYQQKFLQLDSIELFNAPHLSGKKLQAFLKINPIDLQSNFSLSSKRQSVSMDLISWSSYMPSEKRKEIELSLNSQPIAESTC
ncbi:MAG: sulfotransferase [Gammaproteobacteria bacterium]|jgi:hypothetical protein|nr:sulfotransferase [Gammaproteobacteria bacterium]